MSGIYPQFDKEIRTPGRVIAFFFRPNQTCFRLFNWLSKGSVGREMKGAVSETVWIPRSQDEGTIRTRIFRPKGSEAKALPLVLYFHGGGYAVGLPEGPFLLDILRGLMEARPCIIVAPDYRRSVEEPYPAALDDCYDTLIWAKKNADQIGAKSDQIFTVGDSAGGGLTAAVSLLARDKGEVNVAFQMPLYPMIDDRQNLPSAVGNKMPAWSSKHNELGWSLYLRGLHKEGKEIPAYAAPARATDYSGLPPTLTFVGELDLFRDETIQYIEKLRAAGIKTHFARYEACYHAFEQFAPKAAVSQKALKFMRETYIHAVDNYFAKQPDEINQPTGA